MDPEINKFTESEIIIGSVFLLGVDAFCAALEALSFGIATPVSLAIQGIVGFAMIQLWFRSKGVKNGGFGKQLAKYAGGELPLGNCGVFLITVFVHNRQKSAGPLAKTVGGKTTLKPVGGVSNSG